MATTTYRFVGEAPEVFAAWSSVIEVEGVDRDAAPWVDGEPNPNHQAPGELRPGQTFTGPEDLVGEVGHHRIERLVDGEWTPTVAPEPPADEPPADEPPADEPPATRSPRTRATRTQES